MALRAVKPDEKPAAAPPKDVAQAARKGTHRELLVAMRDRIATAVANQDCPPRDLASLTKRLADIAKEIEALDARSEDDVHQYVRSLEAALRDAVPAHPLLSGAVDDSFDADAI